MNSIHLEPKLYLIYNFITQTIRAEKRRLLKRSELEFLMFYIFQEHLKPKQDKYDFLLQRLPAVFSNDFFLL